MAHFDTMTPNNCHIPCHISLNSLTSDSPTEIPDLVYCLCNGVISHGQRCDSVWSIFPEMLQNFLKECAFLFLCMGQNFQNFLKNHISGHGAQTGGLRVFCLPHTQKQALNQCVHDLCKPCCVLRVFYLHAQTAIDAGAIGTWQTMVILIMGNTQRPKFKPHTGIKMAQVLGSVDSPLLLWE